jgi:hypothetical protein
MDWNKKIVKGPMPIWTVVLFAALSGAFVSYLVKIQIGNEKTDWVQIIVCFILGASAYIYLWLLARLAKNPTPWLRRNFGLILGIGGALNAIVIIWSMLSKK